ncbi:MAG: hypothetical protein QM504_13785 [Pseudomonadota bacterium]
MTIKKKLKNLTVSDAMKIIPSMLSPFCAVLVPYLPKDILEKYYDSKLTLSLLKNNEVIFDKLLSDLNKEMIEQSAKLLKQKNPFDAVQLQN